MYRYLPLQKNIEFHKLIGWVIGGSALGHVSFHMLNVASSLESRLAAFAAFGAQPWYTGCQSMI